MRHEDSSRTAGIVETAVEIAIRRRETFDRLRAALVAKDDKKALQIARELCGVNP